MEMTRRRRGSAQRLIATTLIRVVDIVFLSLINLIYVIYSTGNSARFTASILETRRNMVLLTLPVAYRCGAFSLLRDLGVNKIIGCTIVEGVIMKARFRYKRST